MIVFNKPYLSGKEEEYVIDAIRSKRHCGNLKYTSLCTEFMEKRYGIKKVFLTPSCTDALEMAAILIDLKPGDEVILPSYTFSSTANAISLRGAKPVFIEIRPDTFNIDETKIEEAITENTKAIFPIDYGGVSPDMDTIMKIANKHGLWVVEDAAQGMESKYKNKYVGSIPHLATFSFHETKNYTCGEGGALLVNDESLIRKAEFIQEKGTDRSLVVAGMKNKYSWVTLGSSFLLSDISAAFLYAQLENLDTITLKRKVVFDAYYNVLKTFLQDNDGFSIQAIPAECETNYHAFYIVFESEATRNDFISKMKKHGVSSYIGYIPLHSAPMGLELGYNQEDLPMTENIASRIVRMPIWAGMSDEEIEYVVFHLNQVLNSLQELVCL